ncbi:MAG: hypothetical protein EOL95_00235 [Bacteroidia bacterium]|nr:hypothetical protein [Bacteroidia bacterium]
MKNLGILIVILGALALIIPSFANFESNTTLVIGLALLVIGVVVHIIVSRKNLDSNTKTKK